MKKGTLVEGEQLIGLLAVMLKNAGQLQKNTVVTTMMSNLALDHYLADNEIAVKRVNVGDKYISYKLQEHGFNFGGETSGHVLLDDYCHSGDGLLTALQVMRLMETRNQPLSAILSKTFKLYPQYVESVNVANKQAIFAQEELTSLIKTLKNEEPDYRILVRPSGTEDLIRVMAEGSSQITARMLVSKIIAQIKKLEEAK